MVTYAGLGPGAVRLAGPFGRGRGFSPVLGARRGARGAVWGWLQGTGFVGRVVAAVLVGLALWMLPLAPNAAAHVSMAASAGEGLSPSVRPSLPSPPPNPLPLSLTISRLPHALPPSLPPSLPSSLPLSLSLSLPPSLPTGSGVVPPLWKLCLLGVLLVTSACLAGAETAITTLWPWKVKKIAEEEVRSCTQ